MLQTLRCTSGESVVAMGVLLRGEGPVRGNVSQF